MDVSPVTLSPTPSAAPGVGSASLGTEGAGAPGGSGQAGGFADVFSHFLPPPMRQDLAAAPTTGLASNPAFSFPTLIKQELGAGMAVITPASPSPEMASLAAFARAQGLDEQAISALFGPPGSGAPAKTQNALASPSQDALGLPQLASGSANLDLQTLTNSMAWAIGTPTKQLGPTLTTPSAIAATPNDTPSTSTAMALGLIGGLQMLTELSQDPQHASLPEPAALQASLRGLLPVRLSPQNKTGLTEFTPAAAPPVWTAPSPQSPTVTLDLEADLASITGSPVPSDAPPTSAAAMQALGSERAQVQNLASPLAEAAPQVISGYQLKAEHYQQLADKMGQAMAQRLQEQINKGEWSLQLRLNPEQLGQIDVKLDMHAGGLDAMFKAENPLTRDLIAMGANRLKEGLAQSGTTVASVWVNSDGSRQSGGNPTPQQQRRSTPGSDSVKAVAATADANAPAAARTPADGWDLLA